MWTKIATALIPRLLTDAYDFIITKYQEEEEKEDKPEVKPRKKKDTTKFTVDQINFIREMYIKWKLSGYTSIGSLKINTQTEFTNEINTLLGTNKGVTAIFDVVYSRKQYKNGL